jgi:hypothetical protein
LQKTLTVGTKKTPTKEKRNVLLRQIEFQLAVEKIHGCIILLPTLAEGVILAVEGGAHLPGENILV